MTGRGEPQALTVRLDADMHERLRTASFKQRVPMSDLIRDALDKTLPHHEQGCDVCGARPFKVSTPGAIRFCAEHEGSRAMTARSKDRGVQVEALPAEIVRVDRYTVLVNGMRVRADEHQERRLRAMTPEQQRRFLSIFGADR